MELKLFAIATVILAAAIMGNSILMLKNSKHATRNPWLLSIGAVLLIGACVINAAVIFERASFAALLQGS